MAFKPVAKPPRKFSGEVVPEFRAYELAGNLVGEVYVPANLVPDWTPGITFDVLVGEDEDAGWFCLIPADRKSKSRLRSNTKGTVSYRERSLAVGIDAPVDRKAIEFRVDGSSFYFKR